MRVVIYVGPAPSRDLVIQFSVQIVPVASAVMLITGSGQQALLDDAARRLHIPTGVPVTLRAFEGSAQAAILGAAHEQPCDLVIFGRLHQPIGRLLPGSHSKVIAQRLEPSVLRVHGVARPLKRILIASGGDYHTFADVDLTARLAAPLGASVTILHVISQQSLLFEGLPRRLSPIEDFLAGDSSVARTLHTAAAQLQRQGVPTQIKGRIGSVVDEILAELRVGSYDLLVLGTHRAASTLDRLLLEDITGDLLDLSALPVLIVKGEA